jgi:DNA mismatch repair protein MutS2
VVPISIELEGERLELVITGPNAGGKTVALKTVGLLALMAQSGLAVPASRMETVVFDAVLPDIGDAQSIEQNLSTFSAHIARLNFIFRTASADSLVLIDELGAATDPEEGAALAVAIAEHLAAIGCITIISTHHTSLKVFAENSPRALNAAVGFDSVTLKPTYQLKLGVPGASAGIQIAERLGLNPAILQSARTRLTGQARELAEFLDRLHRELEEVEAERVGLRKKQDELARAEARLESEGRREQQRQAKALERKLESLLRDLEYRAREAVAGIADRTRAQKIQKETERRTARLSREFREQFDSAVVAHLTGADQGDPEARPGMVREVSEGDWVKIKSVGRTAKVTRRLDGNHFEVAVGAMKMKVPMDDVAEVVTRAGESPVEAARARGVSVALARGLDQVSSEINVIGYTVEDATRAVEKFVDRAFLAGLPRVRIVHGSGMGILRRALRQLLAQHPHVQAVSEPAQKEGGAGATVAELKQ